MTLKFKIASALLFVSASSIAQPDFRDRSYWYVGSFIGQSTIFLGSEDIRQGGGLSIAYAKPERRFRYGQVKGQLVVEGYLNRTYSVNEADDSPPTNAMGVLVMSRWHGRRDRNGQGAFLDLGWGLQLADRRTIDLDSRLNSTPVVDIGTTFLLGRQELMVALRYLHASNAGLVGRNQGSNQFYFMAGVRF